MNEHYVKWIQLVSPDIWTVNHALHTLHWERCKWAWAEQLRPETHEHDTAFQRPARPRLEQHDQKVNGLPKEGVVTYAAASKQLPNQPISAPFR